MNKTIAIVLGLLILGCNPSPRSVMPLGKVVVYRNGVAYFEREARIAGGELTLSVPRGKVDDFLKSLTVRNKSTGESLPVSFPSGHSNRGEMIEMVVSLPVSDGTDVVLSYITESPAWKPSYRVHLSQDGELELEGWAIVDNTSGENWQDVVVGVGSSSALSFRYDLWSIRSVAREALGGEDRFAVAPPVGSSPYKATPEKEVAIVEMKDEEIAIEGSPTIKPAPPTIDQSATAQGTTLDMNQSKNIPIPGRSFESALESAAGSSDDVGVSFSGSASLEDSYVVDGVNTTGRTYGNLKEKRRAERARKAAAEKRARLLAARKARLDANERRNAALATKIKRGGTPVVIEGYSHLGDKDAAANSAARANHVRNNLILKGVAPALVTARGMGAREGVPPGVRVVAAAGGVQAEQNPDAAPVGESHFRSKAAMTVARGTSAMVSIIKAKTDGDVVYFYDSESDRGNETFAFKAVRMTNPTESTLEAGPVTVYGDSRFIGEGLTDPIPPKSVALVPFALDRQVVVEKTAERSDEISSLLRLSRGVLTAEVDHSRETKMKITNRMGRSITVYVKHTVSDGWSLRSGPKNRERLGKAQLFAIEVAPFETELVSIVESTPLQRLVDIRSAESLDMLHVYLSNQAASEKALETIKPLMALHRDMILGVEKIASLRERLVDYRTRMDELHGQIFSLKAVKSGGGLMRHLKTKMREISTKVQDGTIELVDTQERLMLNRVKFQDRLADLKLDSLTGTRAALK